ncbi:MAG: bi-domain-containing oxidoreductase [Nitrospirae bacterium]|nr:bi-domain-containing oxidoreductase [Nitrospirota bacterium]
MKQIIQNYRTGIVELLEVPVPLCTSNKILVENRSSLISIGTERSIIELGKKSLLGKARERPDLVRRFIEKTKTEGILKTFKEAMDRLDTPTALGYSAAGIVIETGENIHRFSPGDRIACIGSGYASHAEYFTTTEYLCALIPPQLSFEEASFGMLGIIALHGIRCAEVGFGETVAVIGLGLLGILTLQILKAYGCKPIGIDIDQNKVDIANSLGMKHIYTEKHDFKNALERITNGHGADAVIITAATKSDDPVHMSVEISRFCGKVVIVGVSDIHPHRNEMWHKEVSIIVSKGGGPGLFDPLYEIKGIDYPIGYIRWTQQRNLEEFLNLVATEKVSIKPLISLRTLIDEVEAVYKRMLDEKTSPYIGVIINYPTKEKDEIKVERRITIKPLSSPSNAYDIKTAVIGAGLFARSILLPTLKRVKGLTLHSICTTSGINSLHVGRKFGFKESTTNYIEILNNKDIELVVIATPHSTHATILIESLYKVQRVFIEKPLCINKEELKLIIKAYKSVLFDKNGCILLVGYNRRHSPHTTRIKQALDGRKDPMVITYRINAGFVPNTHWVHFDEEGGSRIIGEVCHFVDFMQAITGCDPVKAYAEIISSNNTTSLNCDNTIITLKFEDGSIGNIIYSASGDRSYSREQIEIFWERKTIVCTDFKTTCFYINGSTKKYKTSHQEFGYFEEFSHLVDVIRGKIDPYPSPNNIFVSTLTTFKINDSIYTGTPQNILLE